MSARVHVAVAVIRNPAGQYLISQRLQHTHLGGLWEFPGGKVEAGEPVLSALKREIDEELGLKVLAAEPLIQRAYDYPEKQVLLDTWLVTQHTGQASGLEGQKIAWVHADEFGLYEFPAANRSMIKAATLPRMYPIVDDSVLPSRDAVFEHVVQLLQAGHRMIQLRLHQYSDAALALLVKGCVEQCQRFGASLILNQDVQTAIDLGADGVQLNRHRLMALEALDVPEGFLVGASCHNQVELKQAADLGLDFSMLSPVRQTQSHPDRSALGWESFSALVRQAPMPVFALGGMQKGDYAEAIHAGAQGLAGIRMFF